MPAELVVSGTSRCFSDAVGELLSRHMDELAHGLARLHGATATFELRWGAPPVVNHDEQTEAAVAAAASLPGVVVGNDTPPVTGAEDFAVMLRARPGAFMFIGNGRIGERGGAALHTPGYDFNDEIIPLGAAYWVSLVRRELGAAMP